MKPQTSQPQVVLVCIAVAPPTTEIPKSEKSLVESEDLNVCACGRDRETAGPVACEGWWDVGLSLPFQYLCDYPELAEAFKVGSTF